MAVPSEPKPELEAAIDAIAASYDSPLEINNLESAALPNKRAVIEAYGPLLPAVYMGFYSKQALNLGNLRHQIRDHLQPAFTILTEQIRRAATYEDRDKPPTAQRP